MELKDFWNSEEGVYDKSGDGEFMFEGEKYSSRVTRFDLNPLMRLMNPKVSYEDQVSLMDLFEIRQYPTSQRVVTEVAPDLEKPSDAVVCVFPGWGETSASFGGDFSGILLESLIKDGGYSNPKVLAINGSGKGTEEYMQNKDRIARIGLREELDDARMLARYLNSTGHLSGDIYLLGHSMGYHTSLAFAEELNSIAAADFLRNEVACKIAGIMEMMPSTDQPLGHLRPSFLLSVRKHLLPAVAQVLSGKGSLSLNDRDSARILFSSEVDEITEEARKATVVDSSKKFFDVTMNTVRASGLGWANGLPYVIAQGKNDNLIPDSMIKDSIDYWRHEKGAKVDGMVLPFAHSFPMQIVGEQREALSRFFKLALGNR